MSKKIKLLLIFLSVLGILVIGAIGGVLYFAKDESPPKDDDLRLPRIEILEKENAFYPLGQAIEKMYWPKEKAELIDNIIKDQEWDSKFVEELITKNKETFHYFNKVLTFSKFQDPEWQDPEIIIPATPVGNLGEYRKVAKLNSVKSLHLFKQEKEKEAFSEAIKIIKFGHFIEESQGSLIHYLVGKDIKEIGLETLRIMIKNATLTSETLKNYIKELDKYKASKKGLINALKMEYITTANALPTLTAEDLLTAGELAIEEKIPLGMRIVTKFPYFYKPNKTRRIIAESYRKLINNVDKNYGEISRIKRLTPSPLSSIKILLTENITGRIFHDIVIVTFEDIFSRKCEEDFSVIGTQLLLAIKGYQIETGKIITSLGELMPEYFSEVPEDPFNEKQIRFSAEKKIIYSVGSDLKDTGGSEGEDLRMMEDPTFKIEF